MVCKCLHSPPLQTPSRLLLKRMSSVRVSFSLASVASTSGRPSRPSVSAASHNVRSSVYAAGAAGAAWDEAPEEVELRAPPAPREKVAKVRISDRLE